MKQDKEQAATHAYNRHELVDLLRKSGETAVELYGVWDGDFVERPEAEESILVEKILDPTFRFKERGMYRVVVEQGYTPETST